MPEEHWEIFDRKDVRHEESEDGSIVPSDPKFRAWLDQLESRKSGMTDADVAALAGLNVKSTEPVTEEELKKLEAISRSVGIDPAYMAPEVLDHGMPEFTMDDPGDQEHLYWPYIPEESGEALTPEQRKLIEEHRKSIQAHIDADRKSQWSQEGF